MATNTTPCVIGIDYGTDSVRSVIVDARNGDELSSAVFYYPRWKEGRFCAPSENRFRQHPLDYIEGLEQSVRDALRQAPAGTAGRVAGISVDTTGSTPVAVNRRGIPLALTPEFAENPNAMFILWKDHTAVGEAAEINALAKSWGGPDYTRYEGGIYSSEWFWAKILHVLRRDEAVRRAAFSWVEHCDWIPALLCGDTDPLRLLRSRCAAGHKAMWHPDFEGLPSEEFLTRLDPLLGGLRERLYSETYTAEVPVGRLCREWAERLGLPETIVVSAGTFDAHAGAVGGQIEAYTLSKVMGTSTCDMLVAPHDEAEGVLVRGICGQVDGSIVPGMLGLEAGQSAFGDVYAWFRRVLLEPAAAIVGACSSVPEANRQQVIRELEDRLIPWLSAEAEKIPIGESGIVALDWLNGRRTPDADQSLKGAIAGLNLGSDAPRIFRALVEATCFGSKKITDRFLEEGIPIRQVVALGGVAKKSPFVMQVMADVLNMPIRVVRSEQTPALGAAMYAAVAAGLHPSVESAKNAMGSGFDAEYRPVAANAEAYRALYAKYTALGHFAERQFNA
jgi:L-ribulokinase